MIKTFRGQLASGAQQTIVLHTNTGSTGYRIVHLSVMSATPGGIEAAHTVKIYKVPQASVTATIDFNDQTLLAAVDFRQHTNENYGVTGNVITFDREVFNQDLHITNKDDPNNAAPINYYIELEQVKLDLNQNTVATLKDIRNITG
jgi:hypothetical protein